MDPMNGPNTDITYLFIIDTNLIFTNGSSKNFDIVHIKTLPFEYTNRISLSILSRRHGHILLCDNEAISEAKCYWIILGGWNNARSIIKYCDSGKVPKNIQEVGRLPCKDIIDSVDFSPLSENYWSQVSLEIKNNSYMGILYEEKEIMSISLEHKNFTNYCQLFVHSYNNNAFWKYLVSVYSKVRLTSLNNYETIHHKRTHESNTEGKLRIVMNLIMETNNNVYEQHIYYSNILNRTQHITYKVIDISSGIYMLQLNFEKSNYLPHVLGSNFSKPIRMSTIQYSLMDKKHFTCMPQNTNRSLYIKNVSNIDLNNNCNSILNTKICPCQMICMDDKCSCTYGYKGNNCNETCSNGLYGFMCQHQCGKCKNQPCDAYNGDCPNGCQANYIEPRCNERLLPVLLDIKNIPEDCINECTIQLYDKSLSYSGKIKPEYYYTILYKINELKEQRNEINITNNYVTFRNLQKNTKYRLQVILCSINLNCTKEDIQNYYIETICKPLPFDQIVIKSVEQTISFHFNYSRESNCDYRVIHVNVIDKNKTDRRSFYLENNLKVQNVHAYTNYTITFANGHTRTILPDEGVPNQPGQINAISSTASSAALSWSPPYPVRGEITHYSVEYQVWTTKIDCAINESISRFFKWNTTATNMTLYGLKPYSKYNIFIYAHTRKGRGPPSTMELNTKEAAIHPNEINITIQISSLSLHIDAEINCENVNGLVVIEAQVTCISEWCSNKTITNKMEVKQNSSKIVIPYMLYYSDYMIQIFMQRNYELLEIIPVFYMRKNIKSDSGSPNVVQFFDDFSKSENSISLRLTKPYPPTGILSHFLIRYSFIKPKQKANRSILRIDANTFCKSLEQMYCAEITNLTKNIEYDITVAAFHQNLTNPGPDAAIKVTTIIQVPECPVNIITMWNSSNSLILSWERPNKTNGPLRKYVIELNQEQISYFDSLDSWVYTYNKYKCTPKNHLVSGRIKTVNIQFESEWKTFEAVCPVFQPQLAERPLSRMSKNTIAISIPKIINIEEDSSLFVLISSFTSTINEYANCSQQLRDEAHIAATKSCAIIYKEIVSGSYVVQREIKLNYTLLKQDELYIALLNKYNGQTSMKSYKVEINLEQETANTVLPTVLFALLFLLILVLLLVGCNKYDKIANMLCKRSVERHHRSDDFLNKEQEQVPLTEYEKPHNVNDATLKLLISDTKDKYSVQQFREMVANIDYETLKSELTHINNCNIPNRQTSTFEYKKAFSVDGYNAPNQYIAVAHPEENTIDIFWQLVLNMHTEIIISLQPIYEVTFWSQADTFSTDINTKIIQTKSKFYDECCVRTLEIQHKGNKNNVIFIETFTL